LSVFGLAPEYTLFGAAGLVSLLAYIGLILRPAVSSFGRAWEKLAAFLLSLFVLLTFVLIGLAIGALVVRYYNEITGIFGTVGF
jgi:hypothetical protein